MDVVYVCFGSRKLLSKEQKEALAKWNMFYLGGETSTTQRQDDG